MFSKETKLINFNSPEYVAFENRIKQAFEQRKKFIGQQETSRLAIQLVPWILAMLVSEVIFIVVADTFSALLTIALILSISTLFYVHRRRQTKIARLREQDQTYVDLTFALKPDLIINDVGALNGYDFNNNKCRLIFRHDFSYFRGVSLVLPSNVRTLDELTKQGDGLIISAKGQVFESKTRKLSIALTKLGEEPEFVVMFSSAQIATIQEMHE